MPFDGKHKVESWQVSFSRSLMIVDDFLIGRKRIRPLRSIFDVMAETPAIRRARLIEALRAPMPENFEWKFDTVYKRTECGAVGCALGVAMDIGVVARFTVESVAEALGLTFNDAVAIFSPYDVNYEYGVPYDEVTPAMVADKLEAVG